MSQIKREGRVCFSDAALSVWEEGIGAARDAGGFAGEKAWELKFKRDVFKRVIQVMNRIGWTCTMPEIDPRDVKQYGGRVARRGIERRRFCQKGDLKGDLSISGRCIDLKMFQSINCPTRQDHEGRYEWNKEAVMPYPLRLEMERTRRRIRDYLCSVFDGYVFSLPKISSPNPDPLAYFNDCWDGEYERKRGTHRFGQGSGGWPSDDELRSWGRADRDGATLNHGDIRWTRDNKGRLLRGRVYGGVNGQWMLVFGPGQRDHCHEQANRFFTYNAETVRKQTPADLRRKRLQSELDKAVKSMNFERAAVLRDITFPKKEPLFVVWHDDHKGYHRSGFSGYSGSLADAGKFTAEEVAAWRHAPNKVMPLETANAH